MCFLPDKNKDDTYFDPTAERSVYETMNDQLCFFLSIKVGLLDSLVHSSFQSLSLSIKYIKWTIMFQFTLTNLRVIGYTCKMD